MAEVVPVLTEGNFTLQHSELMVIIRQTNDMKDWHFVNRDLDKPASRGSCKRWRGLPMRFIFKPADRRVLS